jgi:hypothetical protein
VKTRRFILFSRLVSIALLALLLPAGNRSAMAQGPGTTERVSLASGGAQGNGSSYYSYISADGRYVAFYSEASNLVSGDTNGYADIFVHDRQTGQTSRVSIASNGTQGNGDPAWSPISANGRYVAFDSYASNLVSGDTNGAWDVFVHDRQTGVTSRISVASGETQGNGSSISPSISTDGRYVAFDSTATNLVSGDTNGHEDVFVHDRQTGQTSRVSIASDGTQGNGHSGWPSISADGRYVAFLSRAGNLVSGDTNGWYDVFVHDRQTVTTSRVSVASSGTQGNGSSTNPSISADGRYVTFDSIATNLVNGDTNGAGDVFIHDQQTDVTSRVSLASDGLQGNSDSYIRSISADGRYVAFYSYANNLVSGDTNGTADIFVHDRQTGITIRVSTASDGAQGNGSSYYSSISADGRYVAFQSNASNLVSGDTNNESDIFVHDRGGTPVILVQDEASNPVAGAQVYRNGSLAGTTSPTGTLNIQALQAGDQLVARQRIAEFATAKDNHSQDASQNWAWRVYITSLDIPATGEPRPYIVNVPAITQTLTLKKDNALIGFNIVASVEWDANTSYLEELRQGFERASAYLYDATDGQMLFERVAIYDNAQFWADADYQVRASNQEWPRANVGAILNSGDVHIFLGRYFDGSSANQGAWTQPNAFRTEIHEFGHYGLGLYDSYFYYQLGLIKRDSNCTSADIRTNTTPAVNATLMDFQFNATEFSMRGVNDLWSSQCMQTHQWQVNGKSDWETFTQTYRDTINPARWTLKTPATHGGVVTGPIMIPVADWSSATIENNADTGICASPPAYQVRHSSGEPAGGAEVLLRKSNRTIAQGKTDDNGGITVLGAANGDRVVINAWGIDLGINSTQVSCVSGQSVQANTATVITLEPAAFRLSASILPGSLLNQIVIIVKSSASLAASPSVSLYQSSAISSIVITMSYDSGSGIYVGTATLDSSLPPSGNIHVSGTDSQGRAVETFSTFNITSVKRNQDATIWSSDGQVELYVPANTLSADGQVSIVPDDSPDAPPDELVQISGPYTIRARSGVSLSNSANLSFRYLDTGGTLSHANLPTAQVYHWDEVQWIPFVSNVSEDNHYVSAPINDFGTYVVMAERLEKIYLPVILKNK